MLERRVSREWLPPITMVAGALLVATALTGVGESPAAPPRAERGLIVPQRSIDVLALGMRPATVRARIGNPQRVRRSSESETGRPISTWVYPRRKPIATFRLVPAKRLTLAGVSTTSRAQRTRTGIGVGSSQSALQSKVSGLDCGGDDGVGSTWCSIGVDLPLGRPQTTFILRNRRVRQVDIALTFP